jgi:hypothetical protein
LQTALRNQDVADEAGAPARGHFGPASIGKLRGTEIPIQIAPGRAEVGRATLRALVRPSSRMLSLLTAAVRGLC